MKTSVILEAMFFIIISIILLSSCTIEKRLYMSGYSFPRNRFSNNKNEQRFVKKNTDNEKTLENDSIVEPIITMKTSFADYVQVNDNMNASSDSSDIIPVLMMVGDCNSDNISYAHKELSLLKTDKEWMKFEHFKCGESKKSSANDCVNTKYYELGHNAGQYSSNMAPDENYRVYGIQYYRLQNGILETDPKAGCFDDGFIAGHTGN